MKEPVFLRNEYQLTQLKYAVIAARFDGKWIFCRHKDRTTWEIPGGHIEPGEMPMEAAKRELYEETGALDADIHIVGGYRLYDDGLLCFAEVKEETGLTLDPKRGEVVLTYRGTDYITDVWLFRQDFDLAEVRLLECETCDVMYASVDELLRLRRDGVLVPFSYLDALLSTL